jgi:hypothetical protein
VRDNHALITSGDIEAAALELSLLEVARAWVVKPAPGTPRTGSVTLVVLRSRIGESEPDDAPETSRWLEAIRRQLVSGMQLGTRLIVKGPTYSDFSIEASVEVYSSLDPATVKKSIAETLLKRLTLVGSSPRAPGIPVNKRDVAAWLRGVDGVKRITKLELTDAKGSATTSVAVGRSGLPRWKKSESKITVARENPRRSQ